MIYQILFVIVRVVMGLWHPVFRVRGRENFPQDRNVLICANHSGLADPVWIELALHPKRPPKIMAKAEVLKIPVLGWIFKALGAFGVRRGENDVTAVKTALKTLRDGENLMLFPEGTRVRPWKEITPKSGAVMLAVRTKTPILPVWLQPKRFPFSPLACVIGAPYLPPASTEKPAQSELHELTVDLMDRIYKLGETL